VPKKVRASIGISLDIGSEVSSEHVRCKKIIENIKTIFFVIGYVELC
jgi:hypothetical protein